MSHGAVVDDQVTFSPAEELGLILKSDSDELRDVPLITLDASKIWPETFRLGKKAVEKKVDMRISVEAGDRVVSRDPLNVTPTHLQSLANTPVWPAHEPARVDLATTIDAPPFFPRANSSAWFSVEYEQSAVPGSCPPGLDLYNSTDASTRTVPVSSATSSSSTEEMEVRRKKGNKICDTKNWTPKISLEFGLQEQPRASKQQLSLYNHLTHLEEVTPVCAYSGSVGSVMYL